MNASYRWLKDFVDIDMSPVELRDVLTMRCATVDDVVALRADLGDIVIGKVIEAGRHPDSDHLWVTKVDAGKEVLHDVVCGAPNVVVGTFYPFAPVGATLPARGQAALGELVRVLGGVLAGLRRRREGARRRHGSP